MSLIKDNSEQSENILTSVDEFKDKGCTLDEAIVQTGGFGRFQYIATVILIITQKIATIFVASLQYNELYPKYICTDSLQTEYECTPDQFCGTTIQYRIDWDYYASLHNWIEDLDLTCDSRALIGFIGSAGLAGSALSAMLLPRLSDIFGRRKILLVSQACQLAIWLGAILSRNIYLTITLNFLYGIFILVSQVNLIYLFELVPNKQQTLVGTLNEASSIAGIVTTSFYFMVISNNWIYLQIFGCSMQVVCIACVLCLPESPGFYYAKKKYALARKSLATIARWNRVAFKADQRFEKELVEIQKLKLNNSNTIFQDEEQQLNGSLKDLIKIKRHLINMIILALQCALLFSGQQIVNFQQKYFKGNIFINTITTAICSIPAVLLTGLLYQKIGYKLTILISMILSLIGCICYLIFNDHPDFTLYMVVAASTGISMAFSILHIVSASIFPLIFRGTAVGAIMIFGQIVSIISPMLAELEQPIPLVIVIVFATLTTILAFFSKTT